MTRAKRRAAATKSPAPAFAEPAGGAMRAPLDYLIAAALALGSFALMFYRYWFPPEKIFDEIYFARAAEEYLQRRYIYESTHPPLTKLLITLSTVLFGGMPGGDNSHGWRFLDVVFGAAMVWLLYVLAKRITRSSLFAGYAAALLALDGMHFVQSRIATPEGFVGFFSLATLYTFYRYWIAADLPIPDEPEPPIRLRLLVAGASLSAGLLFTLVRFPTESFISKLLVVAYVTLAGYVLYRIFWEARVTGGVSPLKEARNLWLLLFAVSISCLVTSKWYGVMAFGVAATILGVQWWSRRRRPTARAAMRLDLLVPGVLFVLGSIYAASYTPQFLGLSDTPGAPPRQYSLTDVVQSQYGMYEYHAHLVATHPYASKWWEWPLDLRPVLYYASYGHDAKGNITTAAMIYSLPNPFILWMGLLCVPIVGYLAVRRRNKGYALIVITYLYQWLPWMLSPRIAWIYHFYVDIPLVCVCVAVVANLAWEKARREPDIAPVVKLGVFGYLAVVAFSFWYFYPELSGVAIPYADWQSHLWLPSWL